MPKRRWHLLGAAAVLGALVAAPVLITAINGQAADAEPGGMVAVAALDPAALPSPLDAPNADLPDLLGDDVLMGDNPTLALIDEPDTDALGNPINDRSTEPRDSSEPSTLDTARRIDVPPAPPSLDASLTRDSAFGPIPGRDARGRTALERYRRPARTQSGRKPVSVIVGGLGINGPITRRAIDELPADVTLSFAAHAPGLQDWINSARAAGHEVLLELPMESASFDPEEPGANRAIRADGTVEANRRNLHSVLARAQGYAGVINYNGDRVLTRADIMAPVLNELQTSGLGVFTDGSFDAPSVPALAKSVGVPFAQSFGLIDPTADSAVINAQLSELAEFAQSNATAVGVGFAYPQTIDAVKGWSATLSGEGLSLVPATSALR